MGYAELAEALFDVGTAAFLKIGLIDDPDVIFAIGYGPVSFD
jgi:hypothetical protein